MGRYDDVDYDDHKHLLGRDAAEDIVKLADGDPRAALEELLAHARDREDGFKEAVHPPAEGWTVETLYARAMEAEYLGDVIQSVIGRMSPSS